jgi:hypothetical protein
MEVGDSSNGQYKVLTRTHSAYATPGGGLTAYNSNYDEDALRQIAHRRGKLGIISYLAIRQDNGDFNTVAGDWGGGGDVGECGHVWTH